jgi:hypothetical protein
MASIEELLLAASAASSPELVPKSEVQVGGVDPLGLRQINFDLMDKVLPGLNNVAERLRPFVLMTWAWRRVRVVIERDKLGGATDEQMRDFVDRIEAIYAWSQFMIDANAGIPGGQALAELIYGESETYRFGGTAWEKRRDLRRSSTGLISPLNYGPGLRSMGWLIPAGPPGVFQPNSRLEPMLDGFESCFAAELSHPAFNKLGAVDVSRDDARRWGVLWSLDDPTEAEKQAGLERLAGKDADKFRREGLAIVEAAIRTADDDALDVRALRQTMAGSPAGWLAVADLQPRARAWRRLQIRQLFRLSLEAMFYWILAKLADGPLNSDELAQSFVDAAAVPSNKSTADWLSEARGGNPVDHLDTLADALGARDWQAVPARIANGLHFCLTDGLLEDWDKAEAFDRLPLSRALREIEQWRALPATQAIQRVIEIWVIAQHAYWCVGRGLADARGRGKTLLRLRIVMDEGGWTLTPGANVGGTPVPTPDRLQTAISLLRECGGISETQTT